MNPDAKSILVIAGELSGDMHAAQVVRALRSRRPDLSFWGTGGDGMRKAGVEILHDLSEMAVMGLSEVLARYGFFRRVFRELLEEARRRRPAAVLLVDYPGFNVRLAREIRRMGIKVIYYICPQVWAWHRSRIRTMAECVDHLLVIFPFEAELFAGTGLRADFVGHPLVEEARQIRTRPPADLPWGGRLRVALLPGSRPHEVGRILPTMWSAASLLDRQVGDIGFLVAVPTEEIGALVRGMIAGLPSSPARAEVVAGQTREVLRQARAALVASGTATIEAALMECPMVVVYKTAWLTYLLGRLLVRIPYIGMVNIVAGRLVCPEFIQGRAAPAALADAVRPLLDETPEYRAMREGLQDVVRALGDGGAAGRAADMILADLA